MVVSNIMWDAEVVRALPPCCRGLYVRVGEVPLAAAMEMARYLRMLESLHFEYVAVQPFVVVGYVAAEEVVRRRAREAAAHGGGVAGREEGRRVQVQVQCDDDDMDKWEQAQEAVQALGLPWLDLEVHT